MVRALGDEPSAAWLEPSHGRGVFVESLAHLGVPKERIVAIELDPKTIPSDGLAATRRGVDFLRWSSSTSLRFDRIVGNPPFVPIKWLPSSLQRSAAIIPDVDGRPIGRGANTWYAFVLASMRLLKPGGSIALVLPSAAEFADYSSAIRKEVQGAFGALEMYRCQRPLFEDVQEGTVVAIARQYGSHPCMVRRHAFETPAKLIEGLSRCRNSTGHRCPAPAVKAVPEATLLGSVAKIHLGGVTGDAAYFLMTEQERCDRELPITAVRPVVSRAKHLRTGVINEEAWNVLKDAGERVWLFRPSRQATQHPKVKQYLHLRLDNGGCNREAYKVAIRDPWYFTRTPKSPDAFWSGMSQHGPWFCINDMQRLNATNTLYVVTFESRDRQRWFAWALAILSRVVQRQMRRAGRRYADGLIKYEPGALKSIKLPPTQTNKDVESLYMAAVRALLSGDRAEATQIADSILV
jgi:hypothetical protein